MTNEKAISTIENAKNFAYDDAYEEAFNMAINALKKEQRKGHWTEHPHEWGDDWQYSDYECSICHKWTHFEHDFFPNCGADMREVEE